MSVCVLGLLLAGCNGNAPGRGGDGGGGGGGGDGGGGGGGGPPATHDVVDPSLPMGIVGGFDGVTPAAGALAIAYPNAGATLPHDLAPIDVQWTPPPGLGAYRVTFAVDTGDRLRGYVPKPDFIPSATDWQWLLDRAAGHTITLTVAGGVADATGAIAAGAVTSPGQPLLVSHDDATGALFYFATTGDQLTGDGTLERLELGSQKPDKYLNKSNDGGRCVGCHALARDGSRVAFSFLDIGGTGAQLSLGSVDATNPTAQQAAAGNPVAQSVFNADGSKLITSFQGKLQLRDGTSGAKIADIVTSGPALYPDWSPDGQKIVFVKPDAACAAGLFNFGQDSIFVYGGSLVTMTVNGNTFANELVVLQASAGENNYYPSWSPDGSYLAFTRADATTKSSWGMANSACNGKDGSGVSYDNPSATTWLLPTGAGSTPFALTAANGAPMLTNSWPKWGPKADGEYLWLSFSSTRPYGNVLTGANAHHQLWITAVKKGTELSDLSAPAVWFPFQDTATKNHIGLWSVKVGDYSIQ